MSEFQAACPIIKKSKVVRTEKGASYKYAPIDSIVFQVKPLLKEFGFSYAIQTETVVDLVKAICIVRHKFGHSESSSFSVPLGTKTAMMSNTQHVAAALTFAKRYAFCNAFGILTGEEDRDGAVVRVEISKEEIEELRVLLSKTSYTEQQLLEGCKVVSIEEMSEVQAGIVIERLRNIVEKKEKREKEDGHY